jgi:hypothetical protein
MAFVGVACRANAALQLDTTALLNHVRGFVRNGVEIGAAPQYDVIGGRVCIGTHRLCGCGGVRTGMRLDRRDVMTTERALDCV